MPETKAGFLRWQDGMVGMSHLRSVALYPNRQFPLRSTSLIPNSVLHTGQIWLIPFIFFLSPLPLLFSSSTVSPNNRTHVAPSPPRLLEAEPSLRPSLFLFPSFFSFLSSSCNQRLLRDRRVFPRDSASPLNRTIIYLFMYNVKWMHTSSWNKHSERLHQIKKKKKIYLYIVVWQVSKTTSYQLLENKKNKHTRFPLYTFFFIYTLTLLSTIDDIVFLSRGLH